MTPFSLIVFCMINHKSYTQMSFCFKTLKLGISKFPKLGLLTLWKPITSCANLRLRWDLKKKYSVHWGFSNNMWQVTCMQVNQSNFSLLVIANQIGILTSGLFFYHNLCFKYPNESCKPILDIYVSKAF